MPVIRVVGLEVSERAARYLISGLKSYVAGIKELGVTEKQVTPLVHTGVVQEVPNEAIIVYVDGLFDKKERTPEVRQKLAETIFAAVRYFIRQEHLTEPKFAEIIIHRTKPDEDGYYMGDLQNWNPE